MLAKMRLLLALACLVGGCSARIDSIGITVSAKNPWVYLGKFGFGTGNDSTVRVRATHKRNHESRDGCYRSRSCCWQRSALYLSISCAASRAADARRACG